MKFSTVLLALSLMTLTTDLSARQSDLSGRWAGSIKINEISLDIVVDFSAESEDWKGTIDIPQQGATGLTLQNVKYADSSVYFELEAGPGLAVFDGQLKSETISGVFTQATYEGSFSLQRSVKELVEAEPSWGEEVTLPIEIGQIAGSLIVPEYDTKVPVVIIIPGSGPTDRDGNTFGAGKNNSLKILAKALEQEGIASLRIDKRGLPGVSSTVMPERDLRFSHYIEDITSWCGFLRQDDRFGDLYIAGHSEGSLVGIMSSSSCNATGFISLAGMGRTMGDLLREQLSAQLPEALLEESLSAIKALESGEELGEFSPSLAALFRPSVQPYLRSVISIDPVEEIAKLEIPILILQGSTDLQVKVQDAELLDAAAKSSRLNVIDGMNHVLKMVEGDLATQLPSYSDPNLPISTDLVNELVEFIVRLSRSVLEPKQEDR